MKIFSTLSVAGMMFVLMIGAACADDRDGKPASTLKADFAYVTKRPKDKDPHVEFVFGLKPGIGLAGRSAKLTNIKATVGGKELEVRKWSCQVSDGISGWDPFSEAPRPTKREWTLVVTGEGDFGDVAVEGCEFSADVEVPCGRSPKEVRASFPLPASESSEDDLTKVVDPIQMKLESMSGPDFKGSRKKGKNDGDMPSVVTGYSITAGKISPSPEGGTFPDSRLVFHQAFVVNGKDYPDTIDTGKATNPLKVVVKYWAEEYVEPVRLTKAASNKGRAPVKEGKSGGE